MASPSRSSLRYLFWCANEHLDFRIPEFEAVSKIFDIPLRWEEKNDRKPWLILNLESEAQAKKILSRSVATKYCIELWGEGCSFNELHESLKKCNLEELMAPFKDKSFKMEVEAFMKKSPLSERLEKIEQFNYLPLSGPVKLKDPELILSCLEFYGLDHNNLSDEPCRVFFGRFVGEGRRDLVTKLSIKKRRFIGNTTMDPQLSLLMANLACVKEGDLAMDPFVGTGSLSLACAQFGGRCFGGDIDFLMLHARTRPSRVGQKKRAVDESILANFEQIGLGSHYLDVVVCDAAKSPWRRKDLFKAIVTDPPYGIREPTFKIGTTKENVVIAEEHLPHHIPQKIEYNMSDLYLDLMKFAVSYLELGGRLVFWMPVVREDYRGEESLPKHPCLRLVANCEQILSSHTSRRLLVMEKVEQESGVTDDDKLETIKMTSSEFREHFYKCNLPRRERKERLKKYGHLNLKGRKEEEEEENSQVSDEAN